MSHTRATFLIKWPLFVVPPSAAIHQYGKFAARCPRRLRCPHSRRVAAAGSLTSFFRTTGVQRVVNFDDQGVQRDTFSSTPRTRSLPTMGKRGRSPTKAAESREVCQKCLAGKKASLDGEIPRGATPATLTPATRTQRDRPRAEERPKQPTGKTGVNSDWKARGQKTTTEGGNALEVEDYLH